MIIWAKWPRLSLFTYVICGWHKLEFGKTAAQKLNFPASLTNLPKLQACSEECPEFWVNTRPVKDIQPVARNKGEARFNPKWECQTPSYIAI